MHLKSLVLKGFKSFAQPTTFAFEPGVTAIVGPNGSGKSNVVDALAWVMGEQGAKNLRGGSMADVIFAGTATRGPLGRAEVVLTIDNADGALPIEYAEVAISRTLFRDGRSEYAINGDAVRLLDVQELLSDSGLGREMHVIVGQGQLDAVLRASAEERRGFVEEAAGILKHRRRKDRTLRKLEAMQANLTRLTDLKDELQRQLKPLGAQAEIAREAAGVQAAVREAKTRLLAFDAARLLADAERTEQQHAAARQAGAIAEAAAASAEERVAALERDAVDEPLDAARRTVLALEAVEERFRALAQTAATRVALLAPDDAPLVADRSVAAERAAATEAVQALETRLAEAEPGQARAEAALREAQDALRTADAAVSRAAGEAATRDRSVAAAERAVEAETGRLDAARADAARRAAAVGEADQRSADAAAALAAAPAAPPAEFEPDAAAPAATTGAAERVDRAREHLHGLERRLSAATSRLEVLEAATAAPPAVAEVLQRLPGARRLQDLLEVPDGWRTAVAAVLGALVDAAVLPEGGDLAAAAESVAPLGAVDLVAADAPAVASAPGVASLVRGPAGVVALLEGVALVEDLDAARAAVAAGARLAATRDGALVGASRLRTPGGATAALVLGGERDAAAADVADLTPQVASARAAVAEAAGELETARAEAREAERALRDRAAVRAAVERRRAVLAAAAEAAVGEAARAAAAADGAAAAVEERLRAVEAARSRAGEAAAVPVPPVPRSARAAAAQAVEAAREAAVAARVEAGAVRERLRAERARLDDLQRRAERAERAAEAAARRTAERAEQRAAAEAVAADLPPWLASTARSLAAARDERSALERRRHEQDAGLRAARAELGDARRAAVEADAAARDLGMRAWEHRVALGAVQDRAAAELGLDADALHAEALPDLDRPAQERALAAAERRLARLGRVNPLALEEFAALEQRHRFLGDQLADLHRTRTDLLSIVDELDGRMAAIFAAAFADTEQAFARIFPVLFPGGSGRLSLTGDGPEPGIEVAVRPAGKKIERLSLLSGGERSLAAVAFLLAIFTARPSPFYILDEVEAALDDANLGRLLEVISSLRDASQLILITHQKRTMEIADALYGVSMRQDGVSAVVGQRLAART